jgi:hypothetical protein
MKTMRLIDTRTGDDVAIGDTVVYDDGTTYEVVPVDGDEIKVRRLQDEEPKWYRIIKVQDRIFSARALMEGNALEPRIQWVPLHVRVTHPGFFLQRVAFVPT